jgi:putative DNA primase/helicase
VDLRTGQLIPHDPKFHMTKITAAAPDEDAHCPIWEKFLNRVTGNDANLQAYLQRIFGYSLTGNNREHAMFFAYGTGRNGKGVALNTITSILADYAVTADPETFTANGQQRHLTELARLMGARLVVAQETEEGKPWAEARIKAITGGDPITANFMRQDHFTFMPQFKLFIAGNHKPALNNVDEAMRARFNLIPFEVTIPPEERDPELLDKLRAEWPGILRWMIAGCLDWQAVRLRAPDAVKTATGEYFEDEDAFGIWLAEACVKGKQNMSPGGDMFRSWSAWAKAAGEPQGSQKRFTQSMAARGFIQTRGTGGVRMINGIRLHYTQDHNVSPDDRS